MDQRIEDRWRAALRHARIEDQDHLASIIGVQKQVITAIKYQRTPGHKHWPAIEKELSASRSWLSGGQGEAPTWYGVVDGPGALAVISEPVATSLMDGAALAYIGQVTAGGGYTTESQDPDDWKPVPLRPGWKLVRIEGDSGLPIVFPGQSVIVDLDQKRTPAKHNRIVVVQTKDGRAYCKRWCVAGDGHIVLASLNSGADSVALHEDDIASVAVVVGTLYTDSVAR